MLTRRLFLIGSAGAMTAALPVDFSTATEQSDYQLIPKTSEASLLEQPDTKTKVWAYNATVPGPIIRVKKGVEVSIEVTNMLEQPTSVHWHGIRIDNAMDGVSNLTQEPIQPGESFVYKFTPPDAGTYWYHPHNRTWEQLARGLYGALIVDDDSLSDDFDRDYTIIADDWRLQEDGLIHEASIGSLRDWSHAGRLGNVLTLNGKPYENLDVVSGERVRLRFINTANARILRFAIDGHEPWLVALDGQPISPIKLSQNGIKLAPAQRADLVVDITGEAGDKIAIVETSGAEKLVAGYLNCKQVVSLKNSRQPPHLIANRVPQPNLTIATKAELLMSGGAMRFLTSAKYKGKETDGRTLAQEHKQLWAFNGQTAMSDKPLFSTKRGEAIKLTMINETAWPHAIHLHGHHFRIIGKKSLSVNQLNPISDEEKDAFRDTVLIEQDEVIEVAFVADNPGKWMLHCHMLEHQASGMASWFEVS